MEYQIKRYNNDFCEIIYYPQGIPVGNMVINRKFTKLDTFESRRASIARSMKMVKDYINCNDFQYFCTWTLKKEISLDEFRKKLTSKIQNYNKRTKSVVKYIIVFETGKKGRLHAHGVITEVPRSYLNGKFDKITGEAFISSKLFDDLGFQSYGVIRDKNKSAIYVSKYMLKDLEENKFYKRRYFASKGLKLPELVQQGVSLTGAEFGDFDFYGNYCWIKKVPTKFVELFYL